MFGVSLLIKLLDRLVRLTELHRSITIALRVINIAAVLTLTGATSGVLWAQSSAADKSIYAIEKARLVSQSAAQPASSYIVGNEFVQVHTDGESGMFTIGTTDGEELTYGFPAMGSTSHTNFLVAMDGDTAYYSNDYVYDADMLSADTSYVIDTTTIIHKFHIGKVQITQRLTPTAGDSAGAIWIQYEIFNDDTNTVAVGTLLEIDTQVGWNDAAPISTSFGFVYIESAFYTAAMPTYWQAFESDTYKTTELISQATLVGSGAVAPDYLVCGAWSDLYDVVWNYTADSLDFGDSAVLYRWNPTTLGPGERVTIGTYYGTGEATATAGQLSLTMSAPADLAVDNGGHTPNPFDVNLIVQNTGGAEATGVQATIALPAGLSLTSGDVTKSTIPDTILTGEAGTVSWLVWADNPPVDSQYLMTIDVTAADAPANSISRTLTVPHIDTLEISVNIPIVEGIIGDTILVPIEIETLDTLVISSVNLTLGSYTEDLDLVSIIIEGAVTGDSAWTYEINDLGRLIFTSPAEGQNITGSGVLCWLQLVVAGEICSSIPISIESAFFNTGSYPAEVSNGGVYVAPIPVFGDVNQDGIVGADDALLILQHQAGIDTLGCQALANANVSQDSSVSSIDAALILMYATGLVDSLPYDSVAFMPTAQGSLTMVDGEIQAGQSIEVPISITNSANILSFLGHIAFNPEHLSFDSIGWSESLDAFSIEDSSAPGSIKFAGAGVAAQAPEGLFATIHFTVVENFSESQTTVNLARIQWNEEEPIEDAASATLSLALAVRDSGQLPQKFALHQNYPNPFNPTTTIRFELPMATNVLVMIYDVRGRLTKELFSGERPAGYYALSWDGGDQYDRQTPSGLYIVRLITPEYTKSIKILLLK